MALLLQEWLNKIKALHTCNPWYRITNIGIFIISVLYVTRGL